jgi:hypothetical protein
MAPPEAVSGFDVVRLLTREADLPPSAVILISTHAEEDYADLIVASPAAGFLPGTRLYPRANRDLLGLSAVTAAGPVSGPRGR